MKIDKITHVDLEQIRDLQPDGWKDISRVFRFYVNNFFCNPVKVTIKNKIIGLGNSIIFSNTAWIAHIIVKKEYRNKGIGFQIVNYLIKTVEEKSIESVLLIATELGEPVYKKAGFRIISDYIRLDREHLWIKNPVAKNIVPYTNNFYSEIINFDKMISGEDREPLIRLYLKNGLIYLDKNKLRGFYLPDLGEGPVFADNAEAGRELMKVKYSKTDNAVIPAENIAGIDFLKQNGFKITGIKGKRMILGKDILWKPGCFYSRIGGNYG